MPARHQPKKAFRLGVDFHRHVQDAKSILRRSYNSQEIRRIYNDNTVPAYEAEDNAIDYIRANEPELDDYRTIEILSALAEM